MQEEKLKFYHGGKSGLKKILPSSITKARCTADYGAESVCNRDKVYLVTDYTAATFFAAHNPDKTASVYEVAPIGGIKLDPDFEGYNCDYVSVECDAANIIKETKINRKKRIKIITASK